MRILVVGAGKSTRVLIDTLLEISAARGWSVVVGDLDLSLASRRVAGASHGRALQLDLSDAERVHRVVRDMDLVVCMSPPQLQQVVAEACVHGGAHFLSASYLTSELRSLHESAERAEVTLLGEMGLDPGIDHMSAMESLDGLRARGAVITAFETFTGGLVSPEHDQDNPWRYKLTWNPRNVVLAGRGGVKFLQDGHFKYIPYHRLFGRTERIEVPGWGWFDAYPNRDSLQYRHHYDLWDVATLYRGTLRRPGFCRAWDCLVQLGLTDDNFELAELEGLTWRDLTAAFLRHDTAHDLEARVCSTLGLDPAGTELDQLRWLGLFSDEPVAVSRGTPARALQALLERRWVLGPDDRDMCVMLHRTDYTLDGDAWRDISYMVCIGDDAERTAMANTVGLPMAVAAEQLLTGGIVRHGVVMPTVPAVYEAVLPELRRRGIRFTHRTERVSPQ